MREAPSSFEKQCIHENELRQILMGGGFDKKTLTKKVCMYVCIYIYRLDYQ